MSIIVVTDSIYYMRGMMDIAEACCHVTCLEDFNENDAQDFCRGLSADSYVIINFSPLDKMVEFYKFYQKHSPAKIIVATDIKFTGNIIDINNVYFLSADVNAATVERALKSHPQFIKKRKLTFMEGEVISLLMLYQAISDVSCHLDLSIKTISLHKNSIRDKVGLVKQNNMALFSLMKFVLPGYEPLLGDR